MYRDTIASIADAADLKLSHQRSSLSGHLVRSALAGMYVGVCVVLVLVVGANLYPAAPHLVKLAMGICFGGTLALVLFAGSELFTGCNLVLTLAVLDRRASVRDLIGNWGWTWLGNLLGSVLLTIMVVRSGVLSSEVISKFVIEFARTKANLPIEGLFWRAVLANWLVCLAVWLNAKVKSETGRMIMIWWCMFIFITCSFEHSVANMTGLLLGLLLPGSGQIGLSGYAYNLIVVTAGNIVGGAVFVAAMYHWGSPATPASSLKHGNPAHPSRQLADAAAPR